MRRQHTGYVLHRAGADNVIKSERQFVFYICTVTVVSTGWRGQSDLGADCSEFYWIYSDLQYRRYQHQQFGCAYVQHRYSF
jgi:hypothetical protein